MDGPLHAHSLCLGQMASHPTDHSTYSLPVSYTRARTSGPLLLPPDRKCSHCLQIREHTCCFLHPLLNLANIDSPPPTSTGRRRTRCSSSPHPVAAPPSPSLLAGFLSDLAEIGGSFRGGFSRAASAPSSPPPPDHPAPAAVESQQAAASPPSPAAADQIAVDVVGAARALAARPEAWIDFPVLALDEGNYLFSISDTYTIVATSANIGICLRRLRLCWCFLWSGFLGRV